MSYRANIVYRYDGSWRGFLCCVFECFRAKELPAAIEFADEAQETMFPIKYIETDEALALRVERSIPVKISPEAKQFVQDAFLSCMEEKELKILRFLMLGFRQGGRVMKLTTNDDVHTLNRAVLQVGNEAHQFLQFLRFAEYGEFLAAQIEPKNNVLPLVVPHFCGRLSCENFMIYDKTNRLAFVHQKTGETEFFRVDKLALPPVDEAERRYRALWKLFYDTVAVEGRVNPKLRRTHMPMRYWPNMTEFQAGD